MLALGRAIQTVTGMARGKGQLYETLWLNSYWLESYQAGIRPALTIRFLLP